MGFGGSTKIKYEYFNILRQSVLIIYENNGFQLRDYSSPASVIVFCVYVGQV